MNSKSGLAQASSTFNEVKSCMCTSDYAPVCGSDKKDYDNACLAQCIGNNTQYNPGHCQCDNSRIICGVDGKNHGECDAISANISISKYIPCSASSL